MAGMTLPREWPILAACTVYPIVTSGLFLLSFPLWVLPWSAEFGVSRATVMSVFVGGTVVNILASPLVGRVLGAVSPRVMTLAGGAVMAAGYALASVAQAFWQVAVLYATVIALGAAFAGSLPAQTVALRHFPEKGGSILGVMVLGQALGGGLLPLALAPMLGQIGWRPTFALAGLFAFLVVAPIAWFFLDGKTGGRAERPSLVKVEPLLTVKGVLGGRAFWMILGGFLPLTLVNAALQPNVVSIGVDAGVGHVQAAYLITILAVASAIGAPIAGWLADRLDPRAVFSGLAVTLIIGLAVLIWLPFLVFPAIALVGLAGGAGTPLLGVIILRRFGPENFPRVQGLVVPFLVPALVGPAVAGWVRDSTGSYNWAFGLLTVITATAALAIWSVKSAKPLSEAGSRPAVA